jgi:hypothetical protein
MDKKLALFVFLFPILLLGQNTKEVRMQTQAWFGLGTNFKVAEHWGFIVDGQMRRDHFLADDNFYLVRGGINYIPNAKTSIILGYAHQWNAPSKPEWSTIANENRIYQQVLWSSPLGKTTMTQRVRNEQRWQEKISNDERTGIRFTDRVRYQLGFNIPIFKKKTMPTLLLTDELLIHFGKEVVNNTFDQNRIFIGIKQVVNSKWSFDLGYMNVYQQKFSGYQYDDNHTLRLFVYYNTNLVHHESGD